MLGEIWQEDILLQVNCTQEKGLGIIKLREINGLQGFCVERYW